MNPTESTLVEGTLFISSRGSGYVRYDTNQESIEIDHANLHTGLHGDIVRARMFPHIEGTQPKGEVVEIIARSKVGFSGILEEDNHVSFLVPSDPKMYTDIIIPASELGGAKPGEKVFGVITSWNDSRKSPEGKIVKILGLPMENNAEMEAIALERGFTSSFPKAVEDEAHAIKAHGIQPDEFANRRDFRDKTVFTIDPEDAKDFDDAISVEFLENGNTEIGIHIADVSHYVRTGTALDDEAIERGTSVYLVDRTIPMLPEILSNDLCSLNEKVDRLTFSAVFEFTPENKITSQWFGKTVIHSKKRFSYESAQKILDDKEGEFFKELDTANTIAKFLTKKRFEDGAISLDQEEVKFKLDDKGVPIGVYKKVRGETHHLIEELMLLANKKVAEYISTKEDMERVFVYRIHDLPNTEKMLDLKLFLDKLGFKVTLKDGVIPSSQLNEVLKELERDNRPERDTVQTSIVRSMAKAIYSTKNIGHYGLAFEYYSHFTSPIRRYPDLVVHRLLFTYLNGGTVQKADWHTYETISTFASKREKEAADAERASIKYKQVEYMTYHIGNIYDGVITGVSQSGIFVEEKETKCEGLVRMRDIGDDFFELKEKELKIIGRKTGKEFKVGDRVKIKVAHADLNKKTIDYTFAS